MEAQLEGRESRVLFVVGQLCPTVRQLVLNIEDYLVTGLSPCLGGQGSRKEGGGGARQLTLVAAKPA
jgi:hypothetical protein